MYSDLFTKPLQGATFRQFQAMIQIIPNSTSGVYMSYPRYIVKVKSYECSGQNNRQARGTATASTDPRIGTCTDSHISTCM